ncbi:nascent polypeptide-associated complex subunit alpha, muscle-specific form-like [Pollicipes pollicipes]|uniref:nascent polypeptide-associated complex subunit alpha, muscle-specific form-like n=1 Tax=Pollicipes pollicipes TaxID=41117 RepID=UPI0018858651|nr:nascent polypeptide-associated complex subunit alpha, muscle-specific form-like [Pollicipes pollicipes]
MDVAYMHNWDRTAPMRFFYRYLTKRPADASAPVASPSKRRRPELAQAAEPESCPMDTGSGDSDKENVENDARAAAPPDATLPGAGAARTTVKPGEAEAPGQSVTSAVTSAVSEPAGARRPPPLGCVGPQTVGAPGADGRKSDVAATVGTGSSVFSENESGKEVTLVSTGGAGQTSAADNSQGNGVVVSVRDEENTAASKADARLPCVAPRDASLDMQNSDDSKPSFVMPNGAITKPKASQESPESHPRIPQNGDMSKRAAAVSSAVSKSSAAQLVSTPKHSASPNGDLQKPIVAPNIIVPKPLTSQKGSAPCHVGKSSLTRVGNPIRPIAPKSVSAAKPGVPPSATHKSAVPQNGYVPKQSAAQSIGALKPAAANHGSTLKPAAANHGSAIKPAAAHHGSALKSAVGHHGSALKPAATQNGTALKPAAAQNGNVAKPAAAQNGNAPKPRVSQDGSAAKNGVTQNGSALKPKTLPPGNAPGSCTALAVSGPRGEPAARAGAGPPTNAEAVGRSADDKHCEDSGVDTDSSERAGLDSARSPIDVYDFDAEAEDETAVHLKGLPTAPAPAPVTSRPPPARAGKSPARLPPRPTPAPPATCLAPLPGLRPIGAGAGAIPLMTGQLDRFLQMVTQSAVSQPNGSWRLPADTSSLLTRVSAPGPAQVTAAKRLKPVSLKPAPAKVVKHRLNSAQGIQNLVTNEITITKIPNTPAPRVTLHSPPVCGDRAGSSVTIEKLLAIAESLALRKIQSQRQGEAAAPTAGGGQKSPSPVQPSALGNLISLAQTQQFHKQQQQQQRQEACS